MSTGAGLLVFPLPADSFSSSHSRGYLWSGFTLRHGAALQIPRGTSTRLPRAIDETAPASLPWLFLPAQGSEECSFIDAYQKLIIPMDLIVLLTCRLVLIYQQGWIMPSLFCIIAPPRSSEIPLTAKRKNIVWKQFSVKRNIPIWCNKGIGSKRVYVIRSWERVSSCLSSFCDVNLLAMMYDSESLANEKIPCRMSEGSASPLPVSCYFWGIVKQMKPFRSRSGWQRLSRRRWGQSSCRTSPPPPPCRTTSVWTNIPPSDCWRGRARWVTLLLEVGQARLCLENYMSQLWAPNLFISFFVVWLRSIYKRFRLPLSCYPSDSYAPSLPLDLISSFSILLW